MRHARPGLRGPRCLRRPCHLFARSGDHAELEMSAVQPSDDELVRRSLAGEAGAFAQLVEKHQRLVFGVALSGARDAAAAEDVAQEAFVEAWRDLPRLRDPARVGSWIAGIARNLARSWHRHTARRSQRETTAIEAPQPAVPTPLDRALDRETQSLVRAALARIPAAYREALVLYYVKGRSVVEVATGLGISEDLARQRLSRGRRALRESLETQVEGALEQLGPSKSFTATVMVAVAAATARKAAAAGLAGSAGKVFAAMNASKVVVVSVAVVLAAGAALYWRSSSAPGGHAHAAAHASPTSSNDRGPRVPEIGVHKLAGRASREQLIQAIRAAQERRLAVMTARAAPAAPAAPAQTSRANVPRAVPASTDDDSDDPDRAYVQQAMTALAPMISDCYKQALATHPTLAGTLVVNFTIEGEPDVGGVVTESAVDPEQSEIKDPALGECVQETMFALEIDPPSNGGTVKVTYPFTFRPKH